MNQTTKIEGETMTATDLQKELVSNPIFVAMQDILLEDVKAGKDINDFDLDELCERAKDSLIGNMIKFSQNKDDMKLLVKKVWLRINLESLQNRMQGE